MLTYCAGCIGANESIESGAPCVLRILRLDEYWKLFFTALVVSDSAKIWGEKGINHGDAWKCARKLSSGDPLPQVCIPIRPTCGKKMQDTLAAVSFAFFED